MLATALDSSSWMLFVLELVRHLQPLFLSLQLSQGLPVLEVGQLAGVKSRSKRFDVRDHWRVKLLQSAFSSLPLPLLTDH